jgi:hypothetical protein
VSYIVDFTELIYAMLRLADTDKPSLHLIYEMWNTMIENVKKVIYIREKKEQDKETAFFTVVYDILLDRWTKSNTPLHCLAHSFNPRYHISLCYTFVIIYMPCHELNFESIF